MVRLLPLLLLLLLLQHQIGGGAALPLLLAAASVVVAFLSFSLLSLVAFCSLSFCFVAVFPNAASTAAVCLFLAVPLLLLHLHLFLVSESAGDAGCRCMYVCVCHVCECVLFRASVRDCSDSLFVWFLLSILSTSTSYSLLYTLTITS